MSKRLSRSVGISFCFNIWWSSGCVICKIFCPYRSAYNWWSHTQKRTILLYIISIRLKQGARMIYKIRTGITFKCKVLRLSGLHTWQCPKCCSMLDDTKTIWPLHVKVRKKLSNNFIRVSVVWTDWLFKLFPNTAINWKTFEIYHHIRWEIQLGVIQTYHIEDAVHEQRTLERPSYRPV